MYEDENKNEFINGEDNAAPEEPTPVTEETAPEPEESAAAAEEPEAKNPNEEVLKYMNNAGAQYQSSAAPQYEAPQYAAPRYAAPQNEPAKKKSSPLKKAAFAVAVVAVCAIVGGAIFGGVSSFVSRLGGVSGESDSETYDAEIDTTDEVLHHGTASSSDTYTAEEIVESCLPSVVSITNRGVSEIMTFFGNYQQESLSSGTGIIIGKNDTELLIVTNYHVVADSRELTVVFDHDDEDESSENASYMNTANIKGYDSDKDIAVISVKLSDIDSETMDRIKIATLGSSSEIKMGMSVIAIGNALGYGQSITKGIVSAVDREITAQSTDGTSVTNKYIQTDAAINAGNSGGALLNMQGEVIGINSAKISSTGVEGMGYAIPISDVEDLIGDLVTLKTREEVAEENRGYLGIKGDDVSSQISQAYGIPVGVRVVSVMDNSPAEKAGLQAGDIITKIDGVNISSMTALQERLTYYAAGEEAVLTIEYPDGREYKSKEVTVTLGTKSEAGIEE